jgi:peptide deformylase
MAVRPIVIWPDARLRQQTQEIPEINDDVRQLYEDLCDTMFAANGLGIAAIQIGDPRRMFLIDSSLIEGSEDEDVEADPIALINPEPVWLGDETQKGEEGCLSFPGVYVQVERANTCCFRATGLDGEVFEIEGKGLLARALQHEHDHLTGRLLVDFVGPLKRQMIKRKLKRDAQDTDTAATG